MTGALGRRELAGCTRRRSSDVAIRGARAPQATVPLVCFLAVERY
jgi:hypothetical protein